MVRGLDYVAVLTGRKDKTMSEEQIEREAERRMDRLDKHLLQGHLRQAEYDAAVDELDTWCKRQYGARHVQAEA